ncbi:hypothetical protein LCGC14_1479080 [marine sediment metagenome]|uniref:Uncharacterized protein n=1 Tax=marine sediment metagenome TaxID=412755 RepID=A0A0F9LQF8_9ZZZZ
MAGRKNSPFSSSAGDPLVFRDGQSAAQNFKISLRNAVFTNNALIPKPKFLFFVKFVQALNNSNTLGPGIADTNKYSDPSEGIVFQIKTVDKPKFNIKTETLHQYNKKRIIQTQIDYQPMTITFHDDVSDHVIQFWKDYYEYYYGDARKTVSADWREDIVTKNFDEADGTGWGYVGQFAGGNANNKHFLERIELYQFYGQEFTVISFIHPKISVFDHDANDYADGREGQGIRITFDYEGVIYNLTKQQVTDERAETFNFSNEYFDIGAGTPGADIRTDGRKEDLEDRTSGVAEPLLINPVPESGTDRLRRQIDTASLLLSNAGGSALGGSNFSFGTGAFQGLGNRKVDLDTLTTLAGGSPAPDLVQKATGVKSAIDNFGRVRRPGSGDVIQNLSEVTNTGIDSTTVSEAASILAAENESTEIPLGTGQSTLVTRTQQSSFSRSLGTGAVIARKEGIIGSVATQEATQTPNSKDANSLVTQQPSGEYLLTNRGAASMNALRSPNSVLGTRTVANEFENPNAVDTNKRLLAEIRESE